jgi:hypothetical protein
MRQVTGSAGHPDHVRKWLPCLACGRPMWTDRCHRICKKCRRRHNRAPGRTMFRVALPREAWAEASPATSATFDR